MATGYTVTIDVRVIAVKAAVPVLEAANWQTLPFWAPVAKAGTTCVVATNGTVRVRVEATPERETVVVVATIGIVAAGAEVTRGRSV
jgi:hypothetical protein